MYFRRVFVALDLELHDLSSEEFVPETARRLAQRGIEIAAAQRGELHFCTVVDGLDLTQIPATPQLISAFGSILSERLDALADEAREAGVDCEASLLGGSVAQELLQQANDWSADLVMLGSVSRESPLSATALRLVRTVSCPVLIERSAAKKPTSGDDDEEPSHVLIADDLSSTSGDLLTTLVGSGLWRDAKCWLTHVVEPDRWPEAWRGGISDEELSRRQAERMESSRLRLHEHLAPTDHRTMTYGILTQVAEGPFAATLRRLIDDWKIDLLVCGSGPRIDALLPHIPCSVLCFPQPPSPNP